METIGNCLQIGKDETDFLAQQLDALAAYGRSRPEHQSTLRTT